MSIQSEGDQPIEREDGPDPRDVPPADPAGRVDDEDRADTDTVGYQDRDEALPLGTDRDDLTGGDDVTGR